MPTQSTVRAVTEFDEALFSDLRKKAEASDRKRAHHNLHAELDDPFQRMIVAIEPDSYIRPHFHQSKPEMLACLRGELGVLIFDSEGQIQKAMRMATGDGCDIPPGNYHTLAALSAGTIFVEAKPGPYVPFSPNDFAKWAPEPETDAASEYMSRLIATHFDG